MAAAMAGGKSKKKVSNYKTYHNLNTLRDS